MEILSGHTELSIVLQMFVIEGCLWLRGIHHTHCGVLVAITVHTHEGNAYDANGCSISVHALQSSSCT